MCRCASVLLGKNVCMVSVNCTALLTGYTIVIRQTKDRQNEIELVIVAYACIRGIGKCMCYWCTLTKRRQTETEILQNVRNIWQYNLAANIHTKQAATHTSSSLNNWPISVDELLQSSWFYYLQRFCSSGVTELHHFSFLSHHLPTQLFSRSHHFLQHPKHTIAHIRDVRFVSHSIDACSFITFSLSHSRLSASWILYWRYSV